MIIPILALILINPGVVFLTEVGVQYRFETPQHFLRVEVGDTHVKLDVVDMRYTFNNGTMNANLSKVTQSDLRWNGSVPVAGIAYFNVSGLKTDALYRFLEDNIQKLTMTSDANGFVSFQWSNWTVNHHSFQIVTTGGGETIIGGIRSSWVLFLLIVVGGTVAAIIFIRRRK